VVRDRAAEEGAMPSMANKGKAGSKPDTGANLGFEAKLWQMADGLRNNMDAAEYKHVVLGLIFLHPTPATD
jgi:type I restriction enzyme M protein